MKFFGEELNPKELSPLVLAYIGDSVYDLYVRSRLVSEGGARVRDLHKRATERVNATAQCETAHQIMPYLTEEEQAVYRRGRNTKSIHAPRKSEILEYRHATGLEALVGYLYITGRKERLTEILNLCYQSADQQNSAIKEEKI